MEEFILILPSGEAYSLPMVDRRNHKIYEIRKLIGDTLGIYFYVDDVAAIQYVGAATKIVSRACGVHSGSNGKTYWEGRIAFMKFKPDHVQRRRSSSTTGSFYVVDSFISSVEMWLIHQLNPPLNHNKLSKIRLDRWEKEGKTFDLASELCHPRPVVVMNNQHQGLSVVCIDDGLNQTVTVEIEYDDRTIDRVPMTKREAITLQDQVASGKKRGIKRVSW